MTKSWKDYLLKSSLPLEYSVTEILRKLQINQPREFKYERPNEHGVVTTFSIDLQGSKRTNRDRLNIELFIECKYRHPSTEWVFIPESFTSDDSADFGDTFITLDALCPPWQINRTFVNSFASRYDACGKGIEIYGSGSNPKTISQATNQLKYSLVKRVAELLELHLFLDFDEIPLLVPIVVTTAQLWRLEPGTTIKGINDSSDLADVAKKTDILFVQERPDNEVMRYFRKHLDEGLEGIDEKHTSETLKKTVGISFDTFIQTFIRRYPSVYIVIKFDSFEERLGNMLRFFEQNDVVVPR